MIRNSSILNKSYCLQLTRKTNERIFYHWLAFGYGLLFLLALTANLRVLFKLFQYSRRRFRDHILLLNLCAADLFVTLVYIPSEIYAHTIGRWHNDEICKIIAALKGLGIYVSSMTIIGISLDRYLSIVHPLTVYQSNIRNKLFVIGSWLISAVACIPQLIIFKRYTDEKLCREMCADILSSDPVKRLIYNISVGLFAYIAPLITIFYSYFRIIYVLHKRSDGKTFRFVKCPNQTIEYDSTHSILRSRINSNYSQNLSLVQGEINSHSMRTIARAKYKTLKLTFLIVICFILCWTPYYCIVFFLLLTDPQIDHEKVSMNALDLSSNDQPSNSERSLLIFMMLAVSNSVFDPLIYGCFMVRPINFHCCCQRFRRIPTIQRTTFKRIRQPLTNEKESKLTVIKSHFKNENHQRDAAIECQL